MRISKILCLSLAAAALLSSNLLLAQNFQAGIQAYEAGQYAQAIEHFEESIQSQGETAAARHNLALAYIQSEQPSEALWQIERAHRLDPTNTTLIAKARFLKQQMGLLADSEDLYTLTSRILSFAQWLYLTVILFWILLCLHFLLRTKSTGLSITRIALWFICINLLPLTALSYLDTHKGSIISNNPVALRAAPASAAPVVTNNLPGSQGRIIDTHENFYQIKTRNGITGWISKDKFRPYYFTISSQNTEDRSSD